MIFYILDVKIKYFLFQYLLIVTPTYNFIKFIYNCSPIHSSFPLFLVLFCFI
nr:MAG TPA: hypothetical protein [Caudoviricetes sp.]